MNIHIKNNILFNMLNNMKSHKIKENILKENSLGHIPVESLLRECIHI